MADDRQIIHFGTENGFNDLQPCPDGYTRFVLVSDTHTRTFPVPPGDILLHAGDLTVSMKLAYPANTSVGHRKGQEKLIVATR